MSRGDLSVHRYKRKEVVKKEPRITADILLTQKKLEAMNDELLFA